MRALPVCLTILFSAGCTGHVADTTSDTGSRFGNVLILFIDDVGTEQIGAYGEGTDPPPTPVINQLAADGMLFRNAWSQPVCSPARAALITGLYPRRMGIGTILVVEHDEPEFPTDLLTLPRMLDASPVAWDDAVIGKWHLTNRFRTGADHPRACGWSTHRGTAANASNTLLPSDTRTDYSIWEEIHDGEVSMRTGYLTSATTTDAIDQIEQMSSPWLLYVPFNAPHKPLHWPPASLHTQNMNVAEEDIEHAQYRAMLQALDTEIGRLLQHVPEDTTVFLIGDNGTSPPGLDAPYGGGQGKGTLYEGGLNVPFIVRGPAVAYPGSTQQALVHVVDVMPTVAELAGVDPLSLDVDGQSMVPLLRDPDAVGRRFLYNERFQPNGPPPWIDYDERTVRDERYKLIVDSAGRSHLYDLKGRDVEGRDLLSNGTLEPEQTDALGRLTEALDDYISRLKYLY